MKTNIIKTLVVSYLLFSIQFYSISQSFTVRGLIRDSISQESIIGAAIIEKSKNIFTTCNEYGFYSINLPKGTNTLTVISLGYQKKTLKTHLFSDTLINIDLSSADINLQQITVTANTQQINWYNLPMTKISKMPIIAGESDVLKALQYTAGVTSGNEGSASLNVRGGSPDQNLYLLDGIPVYNVNHVLGYFSVFNTDALKSVKLIKGGIPAEYHGRASSIVDIYMREGDLNKIHGRFTFGLIASKFLLEGPVIKNKSSFIITGRRSYADILFRPFSKSLADNTITGYFFYDVNFKWNYKFSEKSRIYLSFYSGKDKGSVENDENDIVEPDILKFKIKQGIDWGNITGALRWLKISGNKLSINNTLYYTKFKYKSLNNYFLRKRSEQDTLTTEYNLLSGSAIEDIVYKLKIDYFMSRNYKMNMGMNISKKDFSPGFVSEQFFDNSAIQDTILKNKQSNSSKISTFEYSVYWQNNFTINKIYFNIGINANAFYVNKKLHYFTEPRLNLIYNISSHLNIQASFTQIHQYIHLLTNSGLGLPTDLWVPTTNNLKPIEAIIYDIGSKYQLNNKFSLGLSIYYKTLEQLIKYKQGTDFMDVKTNWTDKVTVGSGKAYGVEFFIRKNTGKFTGKLSYTYSRSFRTFKEINNGQEFPYIYDRPHNLNLQTEYHLNKKIMFSTNWILMSGQNMTYGYQHFLVSNIGEYNESYTLPFISGYNNIRLPIYHRLDIAFNYTNIRKKTTRVWYIGIYNIYNRLNPFYMEESPKTNILTGVSFAPITPFISYTIKF
ncbi:MAG: TonB-dependent receptor [Bacteroidales bacterium]|nr:TonB-dependent receptor [Bacteroidales bacterium]